MGKGKVIALAASVALAVVLMALAGVIGSDVLRGRSLDQRIERVFQDAEVLLGEERPGVALHRLIALGAVGDINQQHRWAALAIRAATASREFPFLEKFAQEYPEQLRQDEEAALWWARILMHKGKLDEALSVRRAWHGNSSFPGRWLLWEADRLVIQGELKAAREALESWSGESDDVETNRLLRLALLDVGPSGVDDKFLVMAYEAGGDENADLRSLAGSYFEQQGEISLARREYIAAYLLEPENPLRADALARFYLRIQAYPQAIASWQEGFNNTEDPGLWWELWFWKRVKGHGVPIPDTPSGGWWGSLLQEIARVRDEAFLHEEASSSWLLSPPPVLLNRESYHWLLAFDQLQQGKEADALITLQAFPDNGSSLAPRLHLALEALLNWRVNDVWSGDLTVGGSRQHRFLDALKQFSPPVGGEEADSFSRFLRSPDAVPALLLAEGWSAAALRLLPHKTFTTSKQFPHLDWLPYAHVKAVCLLQGNAAALTMISAYGQSPDLKLLNAELLISSGQVQAGLKLLDELREHPSGIGYRATYLSALAALEAGETGKLEDILQGRADLMDSVDGQELLARAELFEGKDEAALERYRSLGTTSVEGLAYLYMRTLEEGDFASARGYLDQLRSIAPNEPIFIEWSRTLNAQEEGRQ